MKHFVDGDQLVLTKDDFVDLQESPAVFFPLTGGIAQTVLGRGFLALPLGDLRRIYADLQRQESGREKRRQR